MAHLSDHNYITLKNDYHHTEASVLVPDAVCGQVQLTVDQLRRAEKKLCGKAGCVCGGFAHGPQGVEVVDDGYDRNGHRLIFLMF